MQKSDFYRFFFIWHFESIRAVINAISISIEWIMFVDNLIMHCQFTVNKKHILCYDSYGYRWHKNYNWTLILQMENIFENSKFIFLQNMSIVHCRQYRRCYLFAFNFARRLLKVVFKFDFKGFMWIAKKNFNGVSGHTNCWCFAVRIMHMLNNCFAWFYNRTPRSAFRLARTMKKIVFSELAAYGF